MAYAAACAKLRDRARIKPCCHSTTSYVLGHLGGHRARWREKRGLGRNDKWMTVFCILRKYPTRTARYASDMLEFYRPTVRDGLNMVCLVPTIPTGSSLPKGCILMVKNTDYGQTIIRMAKWLREGTTRMAKRWAIGSFGAAMALRKKAKTTL